MKIKKIYEEETYLCAVEEGLEKYEFLFESILDYFFNGFNLANAELFSFHKNNSEVGITLCIDFFTMDFNAKYLMQISKFIEFINKYDGEFLFVPSEPESGNDGRLGIQIDIFFMDLLKMEKDKKIAIRNTAKKYNI